MSVIPLIICSFSIILLLVFPFHENALNRNFQKYLELRMQVIQNIKNENLVPEEMGNVILPEKYVDTSKGGRIFIATFEGNDVVYFYTDEGLLEHSSGFVFIMDSTLFEEYGEVNLKIHKNYGNGWFYCSTY
jgi:hypothetical protein